MTHDFFDQPILNSPYDYPNKHWELDQSGQPTYEVLDKRRWAELITSIPKPKGRNRELEFVDDEDRSSVSQKYEARFINSIRMYSRTAQKVVSIATSAVESNSRDCAPERLLTEFRICGRMPVNCQIETVETSLSPSEIAPYSKISRKLFEDLDYTNDYTRSEPRCYAKKLATAAGKTRVIAINQI